MVEKFIFVVRHNRQLKYVGTSYRLARNAAYECGADMVHKYKVDVQTYPPSFKEVARYHKKDYWSSTYSEICI